MGAPYDQRVLAEASRLRRLAFERQAEGRFEEAYNLLRQRSQLTPRDPMAWADLGGCLFAARKGEHALLAWDEALKLEPNHTDLLSGKAGVLQSLGRTAEARVLHTRALAIQPESFGAAFGLALLAVEAGDWDEAARLTAPLEARHGDHPGLAWMVARIALGRGDFEDAQARAGALAADQRLGPEQKADALLLRADALDRAGKTGEAFAVASSAKGVQRRLFAERAAGREGAVARLERLSAWFAKGLDWPKTAPAAPSPGGPRAHAFIVGFPRSGTTLLEQALAGHPDVGAMEEPPTLAVPAAQFLGSSQGLERLAKLSPADVAQWRTHYWGEVKKLGVDPAGKFLIDKAPAETASLPLIARLFPEAKIIFAVRDPRDVVLSCFMSSFQMNALTYAFTSLEETAAAYVATMGLAEAYLGLLGLDLREVRHEALVENFEGELKDAAAFLGLDFRPEMLDVAATARNRSVRTPSAPQVREGLTNARVGRWRAYAEELGPVQARLQPWIRRFGYPL